LKGGAAAFARAVETRWSRLAGRPVVLSPRDWAHLARWHALGVPVALVLETMEEAAARRPGKEPFRSLASLARHVEEGLQVLAGGRLARSDAAPPGPTPVRSAAAHWKDALAAATPGAELKTLLESLLARHEAGEAPARLDAELDRRLGDAAPAGLRERCRRAVDARVRPFRGRLPPEVAAEVTRRGLVEELRAELGLPRLAAPAPGE
jgi:hypothetical protein